MRAMEIYNTVTVPDAILCARHKGRLRREEEFHRQMLYSVINRSLGGEYKPDESLLREVRAERQKLDKRTIKQNWKMLADKMGAVLPPEVLEKLNG